MAQVDKQVGSAIRQFLLQCMMPKDFENITNRTLYIFSDASQSGYGQCSYVRSVNDRDLRHCCLVIGKLRITPLMFILISRLN